MKLVVTDGATLSGGGVSLDIFSQFGEVQIYDLTAPEQLAERVSDADGILCNKTPIPAELFDRCPKLRYVGECATGYNNIDIAAAKAHGVTVCNVAGYSTDNFVTKRGNCKGVDSKLSWTQVETGSAITWKYPSCILTGDNSTAEFYSVAVTNNYQQADTGGYNPCPKGPGTRED